MIIIESITRTSLKGVTVEYSSNGRIAKEKVKLHADELDFWFEFKKNEITLNFNDDGIAIDEVISCTRNDIKMLFRKDVTEEDLNPKHEAYGKILACVTNNIPIYLYGPAGSGKNHVLMQIAKELKLDFYFTNSVQQEFKITGFIDAGGKYHETEFYKAFTRGGLFFLDEMDASIPEVVVLLNAAIANRYFEFPTGRVNAHENFRVVAAGNTVGNGADVQYSGRLQLDQSTLDRFAMIEFNYDKNVELFLAFNDTELVEFIHHLREQCQSLGINTTFSYRCISMVKQLENTLELTEILKIAIFKGMDKETLKNLKNIENINVSKYSNALSML